MSMNFGHPHPGWEPPPFQTSPPTKPTRVALAMGAARALTPSTYENTCAMVRTLNEIRALPEQRLS